MSELLGGTSSHTTAGVTEVFEYDLQPAELGYLRMGGPANKYCVDTIIHKTGTRFWSTGRNWMKVTFTQNSRR